MHDPRAIANQFIQLSHQNLTLMQLLKLSYFAHGFNLAILKKPLSNELAEAWKFGPVFPSIYHEFKFQGSGPIKESAVEDDGEALIQGDFRNEELQLMEVVHQIYGSLGGWELSALTHKEKTPWYEAWNGEGKAKDNVQINNDLIKNHFIKIVQRYVGE